MNFQVYELKQKIRPHLSQQTITVDTELLEEMISSLLRDHDQAARISDLERELAELEKAYDTSTSTPQEQIPDEDEEIASAEALAERQQ